MEIQVGRAERGIKPLFVGQTFDSWRDLRNSITEDGIQKERVIQTEYKDSKRYAGRCKNYSPDPGGCQWYLRAIFSLKTEEITIKKYNGLHTCDSSDAYARRMHTKSDRLKDHVFDILLQNRMTRPCALRDTLKAKVHPDVTYHTAHAARNKAIIEIDGNEAESFHLIPAHLRHILERDPGATVRYRAPDGHFSNLFVCPSSSNMIVQHCRPLIALDGTHTRSKFPQMLLLATALDANHTVVLLAYGMAPQENPQEWMWFLELLKEAIPFLSSPGMMFQSDREKGLLDGVDDVFPAGHHVFCVWHMAENVRKHFGKVVMKMFEGLVYAVTPEDYQRRFERIEQYNTEAAAYIKRTADPKHYSRAFIPGIRWGKETSQQAESLNRHIKPQRSLAAFQQSCSLWDYMMKHYYEKRKLAEATFTDFAPNIMLILNDIEEAAVRLIARPSSEVEVLITDQAARPFLVFLYPTWKCSCGEFQDKRYPCVHAWRAISALKKVHSNYVDPFYSTCTFRNTYSAAVPALLNTNLTPDPSCGPSLKTRKRGRPSEKSRLRFREEEGLRVYRRCGVCAKRGHDKRTCPVYKPTREAVAHERAGFAAESDSDTDGVTLDSSEGNIENEHPNTMAHEAGFMSGLYRNATPMASFPEGVLTQSIEASVDIGVYTQATSLASSGEPSYTQNSQTSLHDCPFTQASLSSEADETFMQLLESVTAQASRRGAPRP